MDVNADADVMMLSGRVNFVSNRNVLNLPSQDPHEGDGLRYVGWGGRSVVCFKSSRNGSHDAQFSRASICLQSVHFRIHINAKSNS